MMSDRVGHELLEVPDTPPDRLARQNGGPLRRATGARRLRSVSFRERAGKNENLNKREEDQTIVGKGTLASSNVSPSLLGTSCGMQCRQSKDSCAHDQDLVHTESTSPSSETCPLQSLCGPTEGLLRQSSMGNCDNVSREDKNFLTLNIDELFRTAREEVKMNGKETISGRAMTMPIRNRRKMLVRNGRISPNEIPNDAATSTKGVKRRREAGDNLEGSVMNDESANANNSINCDQVFQSNSDRLPIAAQKDDRSKGKAIVSCDTVERGKDSCVQLLQCRKRVRGNSSGSAEANRLSVCESPGYSGSSDSVTEVRSQACRNDVFLNRSRANASEGTMQLTRKPLGYSRMHQNRRQLSRLDKTIGCSPFSLVGDQGNSSEADSPEVILLRSCRPSRRNSSSTSLTSNAIQESSCDVEVVDHNLIDVDSLESPVSSSVNIEGGNEEAGARARQIELDEILARQLQEEFAGEVPEGGLQHDDAILHSMVQREMREHLTASGSNNAPVFAGLHASFGIGARRREPIHSLRIRPSLPPFQASLPIVSPHRRRDTVSGRWHRTSGRAFRDRRFQFPPHMNIEMRVDVLEAMEHAVENNVAHQFLAGVQRDFNEADYEMLLALDDDNNNCRGASPRHIDRLPVSTVQNDTSDEVCSVCLEMPQSGEVIRHLLCMHKFHKD
ncbi:hypothetical protein KI387_032487, partial [Taxus chinensis]